MIFLSGLLLGIFLGGLLAGYVVMHKLADRFLVPKSWQDLQTYQTQIRTWKNLPWYKKII